MAEYKLTNRAVSDLRAIWNYTTNKWSENQADAYYNQLIGTCSFLAQNHNAGKVYFEVKKNLLGFRSGKHIIFILREIHPQ